MLFFHFNHNGISVTISRGVGLGQLNARTVSGAVMTEIADKALYHAKRAGRNQVHVVSV
jgi:PleD family two-component response regulator